MQFSPPKLCKSMYYAAVAVYILKGNAIGKLLKEQTFNEDTTFEEGSLIDNMTAVLQLAEVESFFVGDAGKAWKLRFDPNVSILDGLKRVISLLPDWKIDETQSGKVGVASAICGLEIGKHGSPRQELLIQQFHDSQRPCKREILRGLDPPEDRDRGLHLQNEAQEYRRSADVLCAE